MNLTELAKIGALLKELAELVNGAVENAKTSTDVEENVTTSTEVEEVEELEITEESLKAMKITELRELAEELAIAFPVKAAKAKLIELILDATEEEPIPVDDIEEDVSEEEADEAVEEEAGEEEVEAITEESLAKMSLSELKELAEEFEVKLPSKAKKSEIVEILTNELFGDDEDEEEVAEEEDEEGISLDDLNAMSVKELKELATENEIDFPKIVSKAKLIKIIMEAIDGGEEEEEELEDEYGISEMEIEDIADILAEVGLETKGTKAQLVKRVLKGIEDGVLEVGE